MNNHDATITALLATQFPAMQKAQLELEAQAQRRALGQSIRDAQAAVCTSMAAFNMTGAVFVTDPKLAGHMAAYSLLWQARAALAHAGIDPMALPAPEGER